jgi:hypothetical protein
MRQRKTSTLDRREAFLFPAAWRVERHLPPAGPPLDVELVARPGGELDFALHQNGRSERVERVRTDGPPLDPARVVARQPPGEINV